MHQAAHRLDDDKYGDGEQQTAVEERGKNLGTSETEGLPGRRRTRGQVHRRERDQQCDGVQEDVRAICEQRKRMRKKSARAFNCGYQRRCDEGDAQRHKIALSPRMPSITANVMNVRVSARAMTLAS